MTKITKQWPSLSGRFAELTMDNECQTCNQSGIDESSSCSDHEPWNMPFDDALATVDSLISRARQLVTALKL